MINPRLKTWKQNIWGEERSNIDRLPLQLEKFGVPLFLHSGVKVTLDMFYFWVTTKKIWAGQSSIAHNHALCSFLSWNTSLRVWAQGSDNGIHSCVRQWDVALCGQVSSDRSRLCCVLRPHPRPWFSGLEFLPSLLQTYSNGQGKQTSLWLGGKKAVAANWEMVVERSFFPPKEIGGTCQEGVHQYENSWIPELGCGDHLHDGEGRE